MYSQYWQVGLDIQMEAIRALAVVKRRHGWQLRYWWSQSLPAGTLRDGILHQPAIVSDTLKLLRKQLPRHISLRIALPAQRILQHSMFAPERRLRESECEGYVQAAAKRAFPVSSEGLALDYRINTSSHHDAPSSRGLPSGNHNLSGTGHHRPHTNELLITAARQSEIQQWQRCLHQAGLPSQVIDITPCALRYMAAAAGLTGQYWLIHRLANEWLWVSSQEMPFEFGVVAIDVDDGVGTYHANDTDPEIDTNNSVPYTHCSRVLDPLSALVAQLQARSIDQGTAPMRVYYSSTIDEHFPDNTLPWSTFKAFSQYQPPLPSLPSAYTLAGGLALRPADV
ncbi:type IV pilus assembly protein PilM [Yersinia frederiksenii]|jgi:pilus assembly protein HofM|uniref:Type IV pilus assembly protein PilM n=1 Tax=Yersinia frederiksenii TaxID=29484 RepID=A0AAI9EQR1_YERFR|nr:MULTISPECIES: pilus assembly protein PilM [Yersinia]HEC1650497.1 pilus assembly protein PilM [Yersinia enterocolitica]ATM87835.1 pilus assembly protein HofM [Yersinia frederiksenii]MCB5319632.1 pilus assembly protein PilM [Yersinia massiliensis]MDN0127698.1 pilus assembly protein PilM [Yersinia massiliensis]CFR11913.1 type IV pilus assembly protein PilM [Yersinia frederiksenii]